MKKTAGAVFEDDYMTEYGTRCVELIDADTGEKILFNIDWLLQGLPKSRRFCHEMYHLKSFLLKIRERSEKDGTVKFKVY